MKNTTHLSAENIVRLIRFLDQNTVTDFRHIDLLSSEHAAVFTFDPSDDKEELLALAKAYQRLIRIIPEQNREAALTLLRHEIHSALQIAKMTRKDFMGTFAPLLNDEKLADAIYQNALKKRGIILLQYMDVYQNNEPHIRAARFS